ncbi:MAG: hypothetical protein FD138_96 [Planctomycetota bacterium]|nr:MAG: hypothetical protein FD138_96 [Planctomycetota bacterium]
MNVREPSCITTGRIYVRGAGFAEDDSSLKANQSQ